MTPRRIQRKRTQGWRAPEGAVSVCRPGKFGNPITLDMVSQDISRELAQQIVVREFDNWLNGSDAWVQEPAQRQRILDDIHELRGKDLMCFCKEGDPCHGDVLLRRANK